jgi:hypothetical protein
MATKFNEVALGWEAFDLAGNFTISLDCIVLFSAGFLVWQVVVLGLVEILFLSLLI